MSRGPIAALRALAARPEAARCAFCGAPLAAEHAHVLDARDGHAHCACAGCATTLPGGDRWRRSTATPRRLAVPLCDEPRWAALGVPVGVAWLFRDGEGRARVRYPGAAGPVAGHSDDPAWQALVLPLLDEVTPVSEALVVRRDANGATTAWRVPMERCWHLAGLLRRHWRGFDGGAEARAALDHWFEALDHDCA